MAVRSSAAAFLFWFSLAISAIGITLARFRREGSCTTFTSGPTEIRNSRNYSNESRRTFGKSRMTLSTSSGRVQRHIGHRYDLDQVCDAAYGFDRVNALVGRFKLTSTLSEIGGQARWDRQRPA